MPLLLRASCKGPELTVTVVFKNVLLRVLALKTTIFVPVTGFLCITFAVNILCAICNTQRT